MTLFFNYGFNIDLPMNNWFIPTWSFPNFNFFQSFQIPYFKMFSFNSNYYLDNSIFNKNIKSNNETKCNTDKLKNKTDTNKKNTSKNKNISLLNYNELKGKRLARIALKRSTDWTGYCAKYVKTDIQEAGLGIYESGHAYQMTDILRRNPNFKEISPDNVNVKDLPEGCVLVYGKGVQGYSKDYGHTEITVKDEKTGETKAASDGITENLYKKPTSIFIPV